MKRKKSHKNLEAYCLKTGQLSINSTFSKFKKEIEEHEQEASLELNTVASYYKSLGQHLEVNIYFKTDNYCCIDFSILLLFLHDARQ